MNIRVNLNTNIADGSEVVFRSPADCSQVTGLSIYHTGGKTEFAFADAHGHNVGDIDHLFAENAVVKVILDVTAGMAFVQNADTNAYIERTFVKTVNGEKPDESGNVAVKVNEAVGSGYTDVTAEYEQALADGTVCCPKEYLWSLGAGRYSITDKDTIGNVQDRYYLQALAGEGSGSKAIIGRILYRVSDFMFVEYYTEDRAYTEAPKFCLDGDGEILYEGKTIALPDGIQIDDGILHLIRDGKPVGRGVELPSGGSLQVSGAVPGQFLKVKEVDEKGVPTAWETGFEKPKYQKIYEVELTDTVSKIVVDFTKGKYTEADIFFESFSVLKDGTETSNTGILRISYMDINDNARRICGDATNCVGSSNSSRKARVHLQIDELGILRGLMQNTEYTIEHMSHINPSLYVYEHLEKLQFAEKNNNMFMAGTKVEVWAR